MATLSSIITPTNLVTATSTTTLSNKTLVAPILGTPTSGVVTNLTGTASININGTVGATTAAAGSFTTLGTSGNVLIGTTTSDGVGSRRLQVKGSDTTAGFVLNNTVGGTGFYSTSNNAYQTRTATGTQYWGEGLLDGSTFTEQMRLSSTGLAVTGTLSAAGAVSLTGGTSGSSYVDMVGSGGTSPPSAMNYGLFPQSSYGLGVVSKAGGIAFWTGSTPAQNLTLDSTGNLLVGATSAGLTNTNSISIQPTRDTNGDIIVNHATGSASGQSYLIFGYAGSAIGSITQTGTTAVLYNTTSDYRLKSNQQPLTGSGAFVDALKPTTWEWTRDGRKDAGFIAHEFQEVCPSAVTGVKDETEEQEYEVSPAVAATQDAEGIELTPAEPAVIGFRTIPKYQAMQASSAEVIANLVAELQSLRLRMTALEAK